MVLWPLTALKPSPYGTIRIAMPKKRTSYHHGNLAESLLDAVNSISEQFGIEAVTLRGCAKHVGVSPSSAFRHYADKRALLTAFATRAIRQLTQVLQEANQQALKNNSDGVTSVGLAYVEFAVSHPALFRAMWREEAIYTHDPDYVIASSELQSQLSAGFAGSLDDHDPDELSEKELLLWSSVHGLAHLFVDGNLYNSISVFERMKQADKMLQVLRPALEQNSP